MLHLALFVVLSGCLVSPLAGQAVSVRVHSLAGAAGSPSAVWTVSNSNGSISLTTALPNYALGALQQHGNISDPLYRCTQCLLL